MPVTQARLPGFQSAKSARWYQALIGPIQATGSAGGFDSFFALQNLPPFHPLRFETGADFADGILYTFLPAGRLPFCGCTAQSSFIRHTSMLLSQSPFSDTSTPMFISASPVMRRPSSQT